MHTNRIPDVLARTADLLRDAPGQQGGALWRLAADGRQLDANLIRLAPGAGVAPHVEPDLDVLVYVADGGGRLDGAGDDGGRELRAGALVWLPHGAERAIEAGPDGLVYLTVHRRRPGMAIRGAAVEEPGGEAACLLDRVCVECGRLATESDARFCGRCGTRLPIDE